MIFARYDICRSESVHCNLQIKIKMSEVLLGVMDKQCMESLILIYCSFPNINYIPDLKHFEIISNRYELWRSDPDKCCSADITTDPQQPMQLLADLGD